MRKLLSLACGTLIFLSSCASKENKQDEFTLSGLNKSKFNTEIEGKQVSLFQLKNTAGAEVAITNYGGRIVSVWMPDRNGVFGDVVLGHDSISDYINIDGNFGALIGRYGNRINQGRMTIDSIEYQLPRNNYGHCLHGGEKGFHHQVWDARQVDDKTLELTYVSADGEAGFPGNLTVKVTYSLSDDNALTINYDAQTDKATVANLTNHSYFNLSGDPSTPITDQLVIINADGFTPIDSTFMTTGEILPVENTPMDFRTATAVGERINTPDYEQLKNGLGYDHNYVLNTNGKTDVVAAKVIDPKSGRSLEVFTNEPGIQFYAGNFLDGTVKGKKGIAYPQRSAMCLETQHFPDSPNKANWPAVLLRPGEKYNSICIYKFGVEK